MDLTKLQIHTMTISDLDEIKENLNENFNNFWNYKIFKEELVNNNSSYLILRYEGEIVCYARCQIHFR